MATNGMDGFPFVRFRRQLKAWHIRSGRRLPWRAVGDPYRVWISEIMLQQTTVAAVVPYFERFLARFPSLEALAAADEQDVLRQWEGLGYYSRARNLHRAARRLVDEHQGEFPRDVAALERLPGIGRYTAGAIASFAFDVKAPILEANTLRLNARLTGFDGNPRSAEGQAQLWTFAENVLPARGAGEFNQALMDLGATVCRPEPACSTCPVRSCCRTFAAGRQSEIPALAPRPAMTDVVEVAVVVRRNGCCLLRQRQPGERWAGLWDFVRFDGPEAGEVTPGWLRTRVRDVSGLIVRIRERLPDVRHTVTRFRITLQCFTADWQSHEPGPNTAWVPPSEFAHYPLSWPARRLANQLTRHKPGIPAME